MSSDGMASVAVYIPRVLFLYRALGGEVICPGRRGHGNDRGLVDVQLDLGLMFSGPRWRYGVYCQRALYVHCPGDFVMMSRRLISFGSFATTRTRCSRLELFLFQLR